MTLRRIADSTPKSKLKYLREYYRKHHPAPAKNALGIREGTMKAWLYSRLIVGGTASDIAEDMMSVFKLNNVSRSKARYRVMQYVCEFKSKYNQNITSIGYGEDLTYKLYPQENP